MGYAAVISLQGEIRALPQEQDHGVLVTPIARDYERDVAAVRVLVVHVDAVLQNFAQVECSGRQLTLSPFT